MKLLTVLVAILIGTTQTIQTTELSIIQNFQLWFLKHEIQRYRSIIQKKWTKSITVKNIIEYAQLAVQQSSPDTQEIMQQYIIQLFTTICDVPIIFDDNGLIELKTQYYFIPKPKLHFKKHKKHPQNTITSPSTKGPAKVKGARKTKRKIEELRAQKLKEKQEAERRYLQHLKELAEIKHDLIEKPKYEYPAEYVHNLHHQIYDDDGETHEPQSERDILNYN